jgi:hypothetical protein
LQAALLPSLSRLNDLSLSEGDFEHLGIEDYRRAFGFAITPRHWRRVFKRTISRDAGAENWARLDIYLDENAARECKTTSPAAALSCGHIQSLVLSFRNPSDPTAEEEAVLWVRCFEGLEATETAQTKRKLKRQMLEFLGTMPALSNSPAGLRRKFERKLEQWINGGRVPAAVVDQRPKRSGWFRAPQLTQDQKDLIVGEAVFKTGGRLAQAYRDLRTQGSLAPEVAEHYIENPSRKSYVPQSIRNEVGPSIEMLEDIHHGPRQAKLNGAHISRDWSKVKAMDWYQADDCTLPVYYYEPDNSGWFTLWRGQCLLMIDLRSTCILGYTLLSSRSYNSFSIRTLITKVCDEHGLPRKGFYFERGIWESSKLLKGSRRPAPPRGAEDGLSDAETEGGLRDLGLKFVHSNLPRSKPVERVLGAIQDLMEGQPGYIGRDERNDRYERVQKAKLQVESRKAHPSEFFLTSTAWEARLAELCQKYNSAPQDGKMCGGISPEQALQTYTNASDPQIRLGPESRYLLALHRQPVRVTANGITLRKDYNYRNAQTGKLIGQTVLAWFDPELPELLCVTDLERKNPFLVERSQSIPAMEASDSDLAREMARINAHHAPAKSYYRVLKAKFQPQFRSNLVAADAANLGSEINKQLSQAHAQQKVQERISKSIQKTARRIGLHITPEASRNPETLEAANRLAEFLDDEDESLKDATTPSETQES